jgi:hypothetical protein
VPGPRFSNRQDRRRTTAKRRDRRCDGLSNLEGRGCLRTSNSATATGVLAITSVISTGAPIYSTGSVRPSSKSGIARCPLAPNRLRTKTRDVGSLSTRRFARPKYKRSARPRRVPILGQVFADVTDSQLAKTSSAVGAPSLQPFGWRQCCDVRNLRARAENRPLRAPCK